MDQNEQDRFSDSRKWVKNLSDADIYKFLEIANGRGNSISVPPLTSIDIDALRNERLDRLSQ